MSWSTNRSRPNIVFILADDMGFSDIGCFGSEVPTPNIDRIGRDGLRMTQMYNCARCCPSRASLLTGLYPHQAGIGHMVETGTEEFEGYRGRLTERSVTIPEVLGSAGYTTGMVGKWHVGGPAPWVRRQLDLSSVVHPLDRGFNHFWGTLIGAGSYYAPRSLMDGRTLLDPTRDEQVPEGFYYTDSIGEHSVDMVRTLAQSQRPFFLYVAHVAPHWPLHAHEGDIEEALPYYRGGWEDIRASRQERLRDLGVLQRTWAISAPDDGVREWAVCEWKAWEQLRMSVYAAQIIALDRAIGLLLDEIERLGISQETVVMFCSDNGGCAEELGGEGAGPLRRAQTRAGEPVRGGNIVGLRPGTEDTYMSYGQSWANASNSPFRMYKHWVHEGGISTPFLVRWPGTTSPGTIDHVPRHFVDVMATCLDLAGTTYPLERDGRGTIPLEGQSFRTTLEGVPDSRVGAISWEHEGNRAVRLGDLKLVSVFGHDWELYEMDSDRTETNNVSDKYPADVKRMESLWLDWARRVGVVPWETVGPLCEWPHWSDD